MCVIIDANVASSMFGDQQTLHEKLLLNWVMKGRSVIYGGQLKKELLRIESFKKWASEALISGRLKDESNKINSEMKKLKNLKSKSNDLHIIALAKASEARLLYSKDKPLQRDFGNLIKKGKVYPYNQKQGSIKKFLESHKSLCKKTSIHKAEGKS